MFDKKFLDGVGQFRRGAGTFANANIGGFAAGITGPAHLADAMALFEGGFGLGKVKITLGIHQFGGFFLPDAHHLSCFFRQRHPGEQITHAALRRQRRFFIIKRLHFVGNMNRLVDAQPGVAYPKR